MERPQNVLTADAEALGLLREILDELRALREMAEARREPGAVLRHRDRIAMARILPVLAGHFEGTFSTWEICDAAAHRDVLGMNLKLVLEGRTALELGKLFGRATNRKIAGFTLRRHGHDGNGVLWRCDAIGSS